MSRYLYSENDTYREEIADVEECKHLINEVCCNPDSDQCCDFPHPEYCLYCCPYLTKEDGLLADPGVACK